MAPQPISADVASPVDVLLIAEKKKAGGKGSRKVTLPVAKGSAVKGKARGGKAGAPGRTPATQTEDVSETPAAKRGQSATGKKKKAPIVRPEEALDEVLEEVHETGDDALDTAIGNDDLEDVRMGEQYAVDEDEENGHANTDADEYIEGQVENTRCR